jgi:predicted Zn finger-like uncharacterized protein
MTTGFDLDRVDCPGCDAKFPIDDLLATSEVKCPKCGKDWEIAVQDVPGGRFLLNLTPPRAT